MSQRCTTARIIALCLCLALFTGPAIGCSSGDAGDGEGSGSSAEGSSDATTTAEVSLFFVGGESVVPVGREVPAGDLDAVVSALLAGPLPAEAAVTTPSVTTEIPEGVELRSVSIEGDQAVVDLSETFLTSSGSLSVRLRLAQLVYTLTSLGEVERVALSVEGERVTTIGDGLEIENPLIREQYAVVAPEVLIESPLPGSSVESPLLISGSTVMPDLPFTIRVLDGEGSVIAEELLSSDSEMALFDSEIEYETSAENTGSIEAAIEDGSITMRVLVRMR